MKENSPDSYSAIIYLFRRVVMSHIFRWHTSVMEK